jgi:hypothetical protein
MSKTGDGGLYDWAISTHMIFQLYRKSIHSSSFLEHDVDGFIPGKMAQIFHFSMAGFGVKEQSTRRAGYFSVAAAGSSCASWRVSNTGGFEIDMGGEGTECGLPQTSQGIPPISLVFLVISCNLPTNRL